MDEAHGLGLLRGVDAGRLPEAAGDQTFNKICIACHTVGEGIRVGPDLKDVHKRRDRE